MISVISTCNSNNSSAAAAAVQMYDVTGAHTGGARDSLVMSVVGLGDDVRAVRRRAVDMAVT